jgi:DNA-binding CsgD family transcriptional regulator
MKGFVRYWRPGSVATFDERITERIAVHQIAAALTERQKQILEALVICGNDQKAAAVMLGTKPNTIANHLRRVRASFLDLWFEHETPPRIDWSRTTFAYSPDALEARRELARRTVRKREEQRAATGWNGGTKEFRDTVRSWARLNGHSVNAKGYLSAFLVEAYHQAMQSEPAGSQ